MARAKRKKYRVVKELPAPEHPWERQPAETPPAWAAFVVYRDLGPNDRNATKTAAQIGKGVRLVNEWSMRWDWVARCRAYDAFIDKRRREAALAEVEEMRRRQLQMAMSFQGAAALALNKIIAAEQAVMRDDKGQPVLGPDGKPIPAPLTLKPNEVTALADLGVKLERLNRGEPESIAEQRIVPDAEPTAPVLLYDYSKLSTDELRALRELTAKAKHEKT